MAANRAPGPRGRHSGCSANSHWPAEIIAFIRTSTRTGHPALGERTTNQQWCNKTKWYSRRRTRQMGSRGLMTKSHWSSLEQGPHPQVTISGRENREEQEEKGGENERKTEESEERNYQKKIEEGSTARPPPVLQALDKLASPSWRKTTESLQSALTLWSVLAQKERNRPSANSRTRSNHTRQGTGAMRTRGVASQNVKKNRNKGQHVYT